MYLFKREIKYLRVDDSFAVDIDVTKGTKRFIAAYGSAFLPCK
jgi:hypothetical protein